MKRVCVSPRLLAVVRGAAVVVAKGALTPAEEGAVATAAAQAPGALPTPALHHVGLNVVDPAKSQQFYKILEDIHKWGDTRAAMIEDLDGLAIMLVERKER